MPAGFVSTVRPGVQKNTLRTLEAGAPDKSLGPRERPFTDEEQPHGEPAQRRS
jgi:hypothetical protein